jgi:hypothetical protein
MQQRTVRNAKNYCQSCSTVGRAGESVAVTGGRAGESVAEASGQPGTAAQRCRAELTQSRLWQRLGLGSLRTKARVGYLVTRFMSFGGLRAVGYTVRSKNM